MTGPSRTAAAALGPRRAAFLDRDGVLNVDCGHLHRVADLVWIDGAGAAVRRLNESGHLVVVVTNQSGVARGLYSEADVYALHRHMAEVLGRQGAVIDAFYHCPHHPDHGIVRECECRKPRAGMLLQAMRDHPIRKEGSFLVGDRDSDLDAARAAGIPGHRFSGGNLDDFIARLLR